MWHFPMLSRCFFGRLKEMPIKTKCIKWGEHHESLMSVWKFLFIPFFGTWASSCVLKNTDFCYGKPTNQRFSTKESTPNGRGRGKSWWLTGGEKTYHVYSMRKRWGEFGKSPLEILSIFARAIFLGQKFLDVFSGQAPFLHQQALGPKSFTLFTHHCTSNHRGTSLQPSCWKLTTGTVQVSLGSESFKRRKGGTKKSRQIMTKYKI